MPLIYSPPHTIYALINSYTDEIIFCSKDRSEALAKQEATKGITTSLVEYDRPAHPYYEILTTNIK